MKSNSANTIPPAMPDPSNIRHSLLREKETLVSLFLANAPLDELSAQYSLIDELHQQLLACTTRD